LTQNGSRSTSTAESDEIRHKPRRGFRKSQENVERRRGQFAKGDVEKDGEERVGERGKEFKVVALPDSRE